jgi:hypothetical protein
LSESSARHELNVIELNSMCAKLGGSYLKNTQTEPHVEDQGACIDLHVPTAPDFTMPPTYTLYAFRNTGQRDEWLQGAPHTDGYFAVLPVYVIATDDSDAAQRTAHMFGGEMR